MIFSSYEFIVFLLCVIAIFYAINYFNPRFGRTFLVASSLFFYGYWNPDYLFLICGSILFNNIFGRLILSTRYKRPTLLFGVAVNLTLIAWFKYSGFLAESINAAIGAGLPVPSVVLPLAISFFTFQQIAYLVDASRGESTSGNFIDYALFVTFFPQLIAGPIVHHKEMMPQFFRPGSMNPRWLNLAVGLTIFTLGLFKKVIIADSMAPYADALFQSSDSGGDPGFIQAWLGVFAYAFQIYFDFSGYSDMAVGIARMFGIRLPINFNSPYKSASIIEFWRRWHITLSRFLRDYLYIPLGGNRRGKQQRYVNLTITMLLGGLWHGAGWTFVVWGGLHGAFLCINHGWRALARRNAMLSEATATKTWRAFSIGLTLFAVLVAWVFFRSTTFSGATRVLRGMAGMNGPGTARGPAEWLTLGAPASLLESIGIPQTLVYDFGVFEQAVLVIALLVVVFSLPNTLEFMARYRPTVEPIRARASRISWRPTLRWALAITAVLMISVLGMSKVSPFLYFQF